MKSNRLPLYIIFVLVGVALIWRITNPRAPMLPGPMGGLGGWRSLRTLGEMDSQATNPSGTLWAGAWNEAIKSGESRSAVRIIDFNEYSTKSCALPDGIKIEDLSWADDNTIRVSFTSTTDSAKGLGIILVDAAAGKVKGSANYCADAAQMLHWPNGSNTFVAETAGKPDALAAFSSGDGATCKMIGKKVPYGAAKDISLYKDAGIAPDGSSFVFSLADPAAKNGRSYYLADSQAGTAKKAFELGDVPGRIEGIWPSAASVLLVCNVKDKLEDVIYDPATGKLVVQPNGVGDLGKWPGAPKIIALTSYDGGFEFDLATGKSKAAFDLTKRTSNADKGWRDMIRGSRFYRLKSGNFVTVSESSGAIDIRELKPDGEWYRNMLPRQ
jgi:hypothetical protein